MSLGFNRQTRWYSTKEQLYGDWSELEFTALLYSLLNNIISWSFKKKWLKFHPFCEWNVFQYVGWARIGMKGTEKCPTEMKQTTGCLLTSKFGFGSMLPFLALIRVQRELCDIFSFPDVVATHVFGTVEWSLKSGVFQDWVKNPIWADFYTHLLRNWLLKLWFVITYYSWFNLCRIQSVSKQI